MWGENWGAVGEGCGDCGWCWALIFFIFLWMMENVEYRMDKWFYGIFFSVDAKSANN